MKFSLIIPVYNVEKFLLDCIVTCLNQKNMALGKDYELIFVNDGSNDNSEQVIENMRPQMGGVCTCKSE